MNKVNYDIFCENFETFIMNEFENGENMFKIIKDPTINIIKDFGINNKPDEVTEEEKKSTIDMEIKKEEVKDFVKDLNMIKLNLKNLYSLRYTNCTKGVQTMLKADDGYEKKLTNSIMHGYLRKPRRSCRIRHEG